MSEFPLHLSAFRALQAQHQGQRESREGLAPDETTSPAERFLNTIFYLQSTLSQSTNYDITPVPWPSDPRSSLILPEFSYTIGPIDDQCLQYTYGTTKRLTMFIRAVTALFWSVAYYTSTGAYFPDTLQLEMDSLSNGLNDWRLESEDIIDLPDVASTRVVKLHILAFYNAICIFRLTHLVLPLSTDDGTRSALFHEVSFYVSEVLSHLRSIERIKQQNPRAFNRQSASIIWPGFIAACEAPQQGREGWVEWWENMLAYRIGNIASLYETLRDVWDLRDRTQDDSYLLPAWRRLLREKRMVIIAL
ncbi:fungal-specific transcription factor domain-containing protein [Aspergillus pseudodeflectus]|uniref:Fungal-specific transcription factor domain-containing protein n=1 Tax=Aspergillus pseudodeflectus TaxID=176178 RepID=A0ABR4KUZ2_9EURO